MCAEVRNFQQEPGDVLQQVRRSGSIEPEVRRFRMPGTRNDLCRSSESGHPVTIFDKDPETGAKTIRDIKEQEVYFGEIPLMTEKRHVHHQRNRTRHRQPVASQSRRLLRVDPEQELLPGKIIPYRGSWVEFEYETAKNILYVRIDRKRKFLATIFLRALGLKSDEEVIRAFYDTDRITVEGKKLYWNFSRKERSLLV
jgi:DNA-directed RNA polymerase subunit beta